MFALHSSPVQWTDPVHEGVGASEFLALTAHCHPVSQMLGFCFVLGLWLGASHRVQVHSSGGEKAINL